MKSLLKMTLNALATLLVLPACALYLVGRLFLG